MPKANFTIERTHGTTLEEYHEVCKLKIQEMVQLGYAVPAEIVLPRPGGLELTFLADWGGPHPAIPRGVKKND